MQLTGREVHDDGGFTRARKVIGPADHAYARSTLHQRRVDRALAAVERARGCGRIGVAYSGGKDSTVLLHLVRRVVPDAPAAFYDSGCEYPWTYDLVAHYGVTTVAPAHSLEEMLLAGGYWGAETETPDLVFDFDAVLVQEPARRYQQQAQLAVIALGLRAQESPGREASARSRGLLYHVRDGSWRLCPLAFWEDRDVWSYLAAHGLRYNAAYDRMAAIGVPRDRMRVSTLIGLRGAPTMGRFSYLRQIWPAGWRRLAAAYPKIARYT